MNNWLHEQAESGGALEPFEETGQRAFSACSLPNLAELSNVGFNGSVAGFCARNLD